MTQDTALSIMKLGHSVFLTGGAGTGKTHVLNAYIKWCKSHSIPIAVTASTGIAATHIGGTTLHSWAGIGITEKLTEMDIDRIMQKKTVYDRYTKTQVLVIDEISMLHAHRLDMVDKLAKEIRRSKEPFGGMQVILCGDFFQLPPVSKGAAMKFGNTGQDFAFYAESWKKLNPVICYLNKNYRQSDDPLHSILTAIRSGDIDDGIYETLRDITESSEHITLEDTHYTKLYTHNVDVDEINKGEYIRLSGTEKKYEMISKGKQQYVDFLKDNTLALETIALKIGTKVLFIKNDPGKRYSNGTLGTVTDFAKSGYPIVTTRDDDTIEVAPDVWRYEQDDKVLAEIQQLPLRYAWAITIHKSQGMTLDAAEIDLTKSFGFGMGYVALSRLRSLAGLRLLGISGNALAIHPDSMHYDVTLRDKSERARLALDKYEGHELHEKHAQFIIRSGGTIEEIDVDTIKELHKKESIPTRLATKNILTQNKETTLEELAEVRNLAVGTIISHIEELAKNNEIKKDDIQHIVDVYIKNKTMIKNIVLSFPTADTKLTEAMNNYRKLAKKEKAKQSDITFEQLRLGRAYALCTM